VIQLIYELRVYHTLPGRMPALLNRFQNATLALFDKHGIRQAGFWTTVIGTSNNELTYLLAWESMGERETRWNAFMADPEWQKARSDSEKDGMIVANVVSSFLQPTAFSAVR
jgi:hypothetical protein